MNKTARSINVSISSIPCRGPSLAHTTHEPGRHAKLLRHKHIILITFIGFMPLQATIRDGSRCSTSKAYLNPVLRRPNLTILTGATVTKVFFEGKRASGVVYSDLALSKRAFARKEVIISAGAIASPQLLLLSGIGSKEQLDKFKIPLVAHLPGVGENLMDHVGTLGLIRTIDQRLTLKPIDEFNPFNILEWELNKTGLLTSPNGIEAIAFVNTKYANVSDDYPDAEFIYASVAVNTQTKIVMQDIYGFSDELWDGYIGKIADMDAFTIIPYVNRPKSKGTVSLRSDNSFDHPRIEPGYYTHPDDIKVMVESIKIAIAVGNSSAFQKFGAKLIPFAVPGCENEVLHSDEYWACFAKVFSSTIYHYSGTCKMGNASDPMAVVDSQLRVYGVDGLRVVDTSIMPTLVSANTNAAAIMIGEKGADMIKKRWNITSGNDVC